MFADRVLALHARTRAGFAVQARAASLAAHDVFDLPDDGHERMFIECACRFAGVVPVPLDQGKAKGAVQPTDSKVGPESKPDQAG